MRRYSSFPSCYSRYKVTWNSFRTCERANKLALLFFVVGRKGAKERQFLDWPIFRQAQHKPFSPFLRFAAATNDLIKFQTSSLDPFFLFPFGRPIIFNICPKARFHGFGGSSSYSGKFFWFCQRAVIAGIYSQRSKVVSLLSLEAAAAACFWTLLIITSGNGKKRRRKKQ